MSPAAQPYSFLLGRFSAFYEDVARIKLAVRRGELARLLEPAAPHAQIEPHELAERVANRLLALLDRQGHEVAATATEAELAAYRQARYVMVALADEIFILDLPWAAAEHWPEHLLEYTVARSRIAGRRVFDMAAAVLDCRAPTPLDVELAAVLLLALQLGFQGKYRGTEGRRKLAEYRAKLYRIARAGELGAQHAHAFAQAYDYTVVSDRDNTRIALAPWIRVAAYGAVAYLLVSSLVWLALTWSLLDAMGPAG
jgi:type VI secretion system protein ImpK